MRILRHCPTMIFESFENHFQFYSEYEPVDIVFSGIFYLIK